MTALARTHAIVRRIRELRRSRERRDDERVLVAEGYHLADEALTCKASIEMAIVSSAIDSSEQGARIKQRIVAAGVAIHETTDSILESLQDARSPQPVLLVVQRSESNLAATLAARPGPALVAVTHDLQDPGNLGSILRTADGAGSTALIACGDGVDLYHPRAVRATMGSIFRLPAIAARPDEVIDALCTAGIDNIGATPTAQFDHVRCDLRGPVALWIGREGCGLPADVMRSLDRSVRIRMAPGVESVSAPAAAAVLLFEARRQRAGT
jgi:TrmH family RNA methyltransferase